MNTKLIVLALFAATVAGAQPRSAVATAQKTVTTANDRTQKLADQQQVAVVDKRTVSEDTAQKGSAANAAKSPTAAMSGITREIFVYDGGSRRDPFTSLSRSGALSPHVSELTLKVVMVQTSGGKAVATIYNKTTKENYLVKVGDSLGRYRVVQIGARSVTFAIEEFGFSRQEKLAMSDTTKVRNQ